ncbi:hypothetical protein PENTCL1PPCAC_7135, partial [Pristionchus entomophagus]
FTMAFFNRFKHEIKRVLSLNLHSYWEVFYLDFLCVLFSFLLTIPIRWIAEFFHVEKRIDRFLVDNIARPIEDHVVKNIAPSGLSEVDYQLLTACLVFLIELTLIHLMFCCMYRAEKQRRSLKIRVSKDETCKLPLFVEKKKTDGAEKEKKSYFKSEFKRILDLDLHSYWEIFYLDLIFVITTIIFTIPISFLIHYFKLEKTLIDPIVKYIEEPLEKAIIRPMAPTGLTDSSYEMITLGTIILTEMIILHLLFCLIYSQGRANATMSVENDVDVEGGNGCFYRSHRIAPKEEKKRPIEKVYQSVYGISSSSLYANGSTEKLMENSAMS